MESKYSYFGHYEFPEMENDHGFPFHDLATCHYFSMPLLRITLTCRLKSWTRISQGSPAEGCSVTLLPLEESKRCGRSRRSTLPLLRWLRTEKGGTCGDLKYQSPWLHPKRRLLAHHLSLRTKRKTETLACPHRTMHTVCPPRAGK